MRTKLRSKTGDIDLGRKRSEAEQCQSSGRRCKYRATTRERDQHSNSRSEASRRHVQCAWLHGNGSAAL
jgi:hypothetical protein